MLEAIKNFPKQFTFNPEIINKERLGRFDKFVIAGMGGSHLAADLLKMTASNVAILVHKNYGLPPLQGLSSNKWLFIASSYSGNTEETLDFFRQALKKKLPLAVVSTNGQLLRLARKNNVPFIQLPDLGLQPRSALGFSFRALLKLTGRSQALKETAKLAKTLRPGRWQNHGKVLAKKLRGRIPVIYSSEKNSSLANDWKIKFNESGKIPSFYNVLPELNHNEMVGFEGVGKNKKLVRKFHFLFLKDDTDQYRVQKRMAILEKLFQQRRLPITAIQLKGRNIFEKIFSSTLLADWTSYYTALNYRVDPEQVEMIEEFKKLVK